MDCVLAIKIRGHVRETRPAGNAPEESKCTYLYYQGYLEKVCFQA